VRRLTTIATALGPERTREELVPYLNEMAAEHEDEGVPPTPCALPAGALAPLLISVSCALLLSLSLSLPLRVGAPLSICTHCQHLLTALALAVCTPNTKCPFPEAAEPDDSPKLLSLMIPPPRVAR